MNGGGEEEEANNRRFSQKMSILWVLCQIALTILKPLLMDPSRIRVIQ
jgi:hypothetical protein